RPILVGTTSVEKSEHLAGLLERRGLKGHFEVLNAKQHAREAHIVAKAGHLGAITVATNMAGRGTDIVLGNFTYADMIAHWQNAKHDGAALAPKDFDTRRAPEEMEDHLIGYWLKLFDKKLFAETPEEQRREALEKWCREHGRTPLRLAQSIRELDGLHIIGTERHEARRIDNQLRGRAGRQGDPGSSRFFLSLDDDLMRIFAKDWVRDFLRYSGMKDGIPLESKMVSRSIEKAQRRVEEHHFGVRKRLLEYDQVMNEQRKLVYGLRQKILEGRELKETMLDWIEDVVALAGTRETGTEDPPPPEALRNLINWARRKFLVELTPQELNNKTAAEVEGLLFERVRAAYEEKDKALGETEIHKEKALYYSTEESRLPPEQLAELAKAKAQELFPGAARVEFIAAPREDGVIVPSAVRVPVPERKMRLLERFLLLDIIDSKWKDHLHSMDALREGIYLRSYGQKDPKLEYKREGFALFEEMFNSMKEHVTDVILKMQVSEEVEKQQVESVWQEDQAQTIKAEASSAFSHTANTPPAGATGGSAEMEAQSEHGGEKLKPVETIRKTAREPGPNEPCPCGSGKKYKKCHGRPGGGGMEAVKRVRPSRGGPKEHKGEVQIGG
ncbi:MAG: SEC-C metal-binding domain-containing protein, partial [Planctomycetota bacterium]